MKFAAFKYIFLTLISICLIKKSYQVFFVLDPYESRCISKRVASKSTFSGVYFVSGEDETGNVAVIKNPNGDIIWNANSHKNGSFSLYVDNEGIYSLCIQSTASMQLTVSFDFHDEKKEAQILSVQSIENLNSVIISIRRKLDIIHSNMRNSAVRRSTHLDITNAINSKISYMTLAKIIFLLVFSAIQVKMLTSIFSNVKVVNTIIINEHKPIKNNVFDNSSDNVIL